MRFSVPLIALAAAVLAGCGGGNVGGSTSIATAMISASPTTVNSGESSTLTWSSTNATACAASGGWTGTLAASGTKTTGALSASATYTLVCTGAGGTSTPASTLVTVAAPLPTAKLTASAATVNSGGTVTLNWTSTNATTCTASDGWTGTLAASGSKPTTATANTTYSLTCSGPGGTSAVATAAVDVIPTAMLAASPVKVAGGAASTLTWTSTNATACAGTGSWTRSLNPNGSQSTGPVLTNSTFKLTCSGLGGTSAVVSATVNVVPTAALTANPAVIVSGGTSTLTWSSSNATACTASGGWTGSLASTGIKVTSSQTATVTYSLICTGAGGTSAVASVTVAVASGSLSPSHAELTISQTQQFTAASSPVTWAVDGVTNGNAGVGTITSAGLYTAGTTPGTHAIVATGSANTTQSAVASVTDLAGVYTYHNNQSRNGANTQEYALTTSNVNTTSFGKLASCPVDGAIYGQPLWVANLVVNGAQHNVVFVATQHDSVYAFDADSSVCTQLWHANLLDAAHGVTTSEEPVPSNLVGLGTGDIQPEIGVTSTPVIDPSTGILYAVAKSIDIATLTNFVTRLHALGITTGNEKSGAPAVVTGTYPGTGDGGSTVTFVTKQENQRAGLALVNGTVYLAFSSHEDSTPWYGWMMAYKFNSGGTLVQTSITNVAPNTRKSGIWMGGGAPAVDSNNYLYALTGNGTFDVTNTSGPTNDYGDSLIQLNTSLAITSYFTPTDQASDNSNDLDFGSGGAALLADLPAGNTVTHALIAGGKDGYLYILNRDLLGGFGDSVAVQRFSLQSPLFATGAMWNNNYFVAGVQGPMRAYALSTTTGVPQLTQRSDSPSANSFGFPGATPSVSASATQNGIVWGLDAGLYCTNQSPGCGSVVLWAYDATNMLNQLWGSNTVAADAAGNAVKFTVPTVANGHVYVGTRGNSDPPAAATVPGELDIYGLKP
jgi:hypothetical protein